MVWPCPQRGRRGWVMSTAEVGAVSSEIELEPSRDRWEERPVPWHVPGVRPGFYKADCSRGTSSKPKRWMADDKDKGWCWAVTFVGGRSNRKSQDWDHHKSPWREKERRPQITEPGSWELTADQVWSWEIKWRSLDSASILATIFGEAGNLLETWE